MDKNHIRQLFSAHLDHQLEGSAARAFDQSIEHDPALAEEYETFAEVIELVRALPRPEPDPDFVSKVSRRIKRRSRGRRRARREQPTVPVLGTLTTIFALVLVAGIGYISYSFGGEVSALETTPPAPGPRGAPSLLAALELGAPEAALLFDQALQAKLIQRFTHTEPGAQFKVEVAPAQLASFLDWLGQRTTLRMGPGAGAPLSGGVSLEISSPATTTR